MSIFDSFEVGVGDLSPIYSKQRLVRFKVCIISITYLVLLYVSLFVYQAFNPVFSILTLTTGYLFIYAEVKEKYRNTVKHEVFKFFIKKHLEITSFEPGHFISPSEIKSSEIFNNASYNNIHGEDYVKGRLGGNELELCELSLEGSKNPNSSPVITSTHFKGLFAIINLKTETGVDLIGVAKFINNPKFDFIKNIRFWNPPEGFVEYKAIEYQDHSDYISLYTSTPSEVNAFLSAHIFQKLIEFKMKYKKDRFYFRIKDMKLILALELKSSFIEPLVFSRSIIKKKQIDQVGETFEFIKELISIIENCSKG